MHRASAVFLAILSTSAALCSAQSFTERGAQILGHIGYDARSASFADIDNDGDPDLLFQGNGPSANRDQSRQLFRNDSLSPQVRAYTNVTPQFGPFAPDTTGWSAAWGDYDGDGDVDVFLGETNTAVSGSPNPRGDLFRNDGPAGFTDVSATTINDPGFHQSVAWSDIDNDGDLDLVIAMEGPEMHEIYLQQEDGSFIQAGESLGLHVPFGTKAYGLAIGDADGDGDQDIYMSTCRASGDIRNNFFRNELIPTGTLFFTDVADENGTQLLHNTYSSEFHDFDDDGDLDLLVVGSDQNKTTIFRNNGDGTFTDVDTITGKPLLANHGGDFNGGRAIDYDNDGDLDLYLHDHLRIPSGEAASNSARALYRNDGNWNFTDVTAAEGLAATNEGGYDSAWADFDLDGDLDLVAPTGAGFSERFFVSNASTNGNHWLYVRLSTAAKNTRAIGAQVYVTIHKGTPQERTLRRDANTNAGAFHQSDLPVHFGLGSATKVDELRVVFPGGDEAIFPAALVDEYIQVFQGQEPNAEMWMMW